MRSQQAAAQFLGTGFNTFVLCVRIVRVGTLICYVILRCLVRSPIHLPKSLHSPNSTETGKITSALSWLV